MNPAASAVTEPPADETRRLAALQALQVMGASAEPEFEQLVAQAALACRVPFAAVTLVDERRQWYFARHGLALQESARADSFCSHTIRAEPVFEVPDARLDPRFAGHPLVTEGAQIRFYAGAAIRLEGGLAVGTLCVMASEPHRLDAGQQAQLRHLAGLAATLLGLRQRRRELADLARDSDLRYRALLEDQSDLVALLAADGRIVLGNRALADLIGGRVEDLVGRNLLEAAPPADRGALRGQLRLALERPGLVEGEAPLQAADGSLRWIEWKHHALQAGGRPAGAPAVHSVGRDISLRKRLERELLSSEQRYRSLFDHLEAGFALHEVVLDAAGAVADLIYLAVNEPHARMMGLDADRMTGARLSELFPSRSPEANDWIVTFSRVALDGQTLSFERHSPHYDRWFSVIAYQPAPGQFATIVEDITERRAAHAALQAQHQQLQVTLHSIGDAVITTDATGRVQYLNPVAERLTGWTDGDARGRRLEEVYHPRDENSRQALPNPVVACLGSALAGSAACGPGAAGGTGATAGTGDGPLAALTSRHGTEAGIEQTVAPIRGIDGQVLGVVLVFRDVTDRRRMAREMSYRATHDVLTGLVNRTDFESRLLHTLKLAHADGSVHALMFIDLDQFKRVNDACGHAAGDQLLRQVAGLIRQCVRPRDTLARLGGDEFGVILEFCAMEDAQRVAQQVCDRMEAYRFVRDERRFRVGASIGVVPLDSRWPSPASALQAADAACYAAKEAGRNRVHAWFDADQHLRLRHGEVQWVSRLEQALDDDLFELFAQRIAPLAASQGGLHCEVLLRLRGPDGQCVAPAVFLPAAERFHLAARIDRWVLRAVVDWMTRQPDALQRVDTLAVNLSGQALSDPAFLRLATELVTRGRVDPRKLCFELSEAAAITNMAEAAAFVDAMRQHGVRFALDDFGADAASFRHLKTLRVDYLKIDGQFVRDLASDALNRATVRCLRELAAATGARTIAESVEDAATAALLDELGIDYAQGFHFHRPQPLDELIAGHGTITR